MSRLRRDESGFALPLALFVMLIVASLASVAVMLATHNVDRSTRDRNSIRALEAADAGLDTAAYRMAKMVVAANLNEGVLGSLMSGELLSNTVGCLQLNIDPLLQVDFRPLGACTGSTPETVDAAVADDGLGDSATFRYWVETEVSSDSSLLERRIVAVGESNGVIRRLMGTYSLNLNAPVTSVSSLLDYVECTAEIPPNTNPSQGC